MNPLEHPYSRYGIALVLYKTSKERFEEILDDDIKSLLINGLDKFRLRPTYFNSEIEFSYVPYSEIKNNPGLKKGPSSKGKFLTPNSLTIDKVASGYFDTIEKLISELNDKKQKNINFTQQIVPVTTKTNYGRKTQGYISGDIRTAAFCAITTSHPLKPCLAIVKVKQNIPNYIPAAIIPDLEIDELKNFISIFKRMLDDNTPKLLIARKKENVEKIPRPKIFHGNFPYAPRSHAFGAAGLLGAIGQWAKEAEYIDKADPVLDSLANKPLYIVSYDRTEVVTFDHYVIELAKEYKLSNIVNALEFSTLLKEEPKYIKGSRPNPKYELFWMMASRFLQTFNKPAFQNFLAFRIEYQPEVEYLLNQYFMKKENIRQEIVTSAKELGRWLNLAAYIAASKQFEERKKRKPLVGNKQDNVEVRKYKAKFLLELESSAFSARKPEALLHQTIRRAAQLSFMDAPAESQEFMDAVCSGELTLDQAKNLLLAYSRLKNVKEKSAPEEEADELLEDSEISEN